MGWRGHRDFFVLHNRQDRDNLDQRWILSAGTLSLCVLCWGKLRLLANLSTTLNVLENGHGK